MKKTTGIYGRFVKRFNRDFYSETDEFTYIGDGELGGKAGGLAILKERIVSRFGDSDSGSIIVDIPRLTVITTQFFDRFMELNDLYEIALANDITDDRIAYHFLKAELPPDLTGDLRGLIANVHAPLAVRSSSLLEDSLESPFAGVYETKMIPNNQPDIDSRFRKLMEAVKFVYASTFFSGAKSYIKTTPHKIEDEKMAVIIQEVVGLHHNGRFYPNISGVARSYNFYPAGNAAPEDGVVNLALGLGKTIVGGGAVWNYSPEYPDVSPPYNSIKELLKQTQLDFWAVNMGKPPVYDPMKETEYLVKLSLKDAEYDNTLTYIASTYDHQSDCINIGTGNAGARIINFAPILQVNLLPVNELVTSVLKLCEETAEAKVEIEFALTIEPGRIKRVRFGLLQVRPMAVSHNLVELDEAEWRKTPGAVLAASDNALGNGCVECIKDIIYVVPETFALKDSTAVAAEIDTMNRKMVETGDPYLLIGFGRWGSSDPWLGIPVAWGQISGTRVMVESQLPGGAIDLSQGSHFFHNISNLGIPYFSIKEDGEFPLDWEWIRRQAVVREGTYIRHVRLSAPLTVKVDGRKRKGVILK